MSNQYNRPYSIRFVVNTNYSMWDSLNNVSVNTVAISDMKSGKSMSVGTTMAPAAAYAIVEILNQLDTELEEVKKIIGLFEIDKSKAPNW